MSPESKPSASPSPRPTPTKEKAAAQRSYAWPLMSLAFCAIAAGLLGLAASGVFFQEPMQESLDTFAREAASAAKPQPEEPAAPPSAKPAETVSAHASQGRPAEAAAPAPPQKPAAPPSADATNDPPKETAKLQTLQAPPFVRGDWANGNAFTAQLRGWAEPAANLAAHSATVFQASFRRGNVHRFPAEKRINARNALVTPGVYDAATNRYKLDCYWWLLKDDTPEADGRKLPPFFDRGVLRVELPADLPQAKRLDEAFERGTLELALTFRLVAVEAAKWEPFPTRPDVPFRHDLVLRGEVIDFEATEDGEGDAKPRRSVTNRKKGR